MILVVGDLILDQYMIGKVHRISPEAPVPVVNIEKMEFRLGGCGNVANNLVQLQHQVALVGVVGKDNNGAIIKKQLKNQGIEDFTFQGTLPTISKTRVIGNFQQIVRYDIEQFWKDTPKAIAHLQTVLDSRFFNYAVISDYNKGFCSFSLCSFLIQQINKQGGKVVVDPKGKQWDKYRGAYLVTPNLKELQLISDAFIPNENEAIVHYGQKIRENYGFPYLLVTRSEKGMTLITADTVQHFKTKAKDVYDVTGAGDTVIAMLAAGLAEGYTMEIAIRRANIAAGYVISKFGTYAISKQELEELF